ncbi:MAG: beta strand repeat-containing protein [Blastocatellales bacterium]
MPSLAAFDSTGFGAKVAQISRSLSARLAGARVMKLVSGYAAALAAPELSNYPNATVTIGGSTTVTPDAAPLNTTSIQVATNTNFKGTFAADPVTGIVRVTNAHPAGAYPVTVTAINNIGVTMAKNFTLTVQTSTACTMTPTFTSAADVGVGSGPYSVAIGDFNGDGKQDFAAANQNSNTVSIRLGDGLGGFTGTTEVSVGSGPYSVAIGDFNGDGKQDFAVANIDSANVSIRLGNGLGGFSGTTNVSVGSAPLSVAIGDFNGDGKQDFATANLHSANVSIRLGDGLGGFSGTTNVSVGSGPYSVAIGDFDGDGKQDFVTANSGSANVSIRLGDGMGGFSGTTEVSVGSGPVSVAIGDFNGDGKQDFAVANIDSANVSIRLGDGMGGFTGTTEVSVGSGPYSVAIGDFNGDGKQDFAAANFVSNNVSIRLGDGLGGFSGTTTVGVGTTPTSVAIGDFNGDGRQDFATGHNGSSTVSIRLGGCQPTLGNYPNAMVTLGGTTTVTPDATPLSASRIQVTTNTDFKGTFAADPATGIVQVTNAHPVGTYPVTVTAYNGTASVQKTFTLTVQPGPACNVTILFTGTTEVGVGSLPRSVAIGDFNGNGKQDVAIANSGSNNVSIRLGNGLGGFSGTTEVSVGSTPYSVATGDFNGDGKQDFATANSGSNNVSIRLGDGLGGFSGSTNVGVGAAPYSVAIGDFNGDGKQDFATANRGSNTVSIRLGDGLGGFSGSTEVSVGLFPRSVAIGDFNGDGKQDFAAANQGFNTVSIRLGDGLGGFSGSTEVSVGANTFSVATGDFNGDGKQDFATANFDSNTVSIRLGDGLGGFSGTTDMGVGSRPYSVAIGDFNGDGKHDFAAANSNSANVSIRLGDGAGGFSGTANVGVGMSPRFVAIGDFNGDGRQDFAAPNQNSNTVSIRLGSCGLPPTISPTGLTLTAGQTVNASTVAAAADAEDALNTLQLAVSSDGGATFSNTATLNGVTVTLTDSNAVATGINPNALGQVLADVVTACGATSAAFKLRVIDSQGSFNEATLNVTVTANTPPELSYAVQNVIEGTGLSVNPATGPSDNGSVSSIVVQDKGTFTGTVSVNAAGVVTISGAAPVGSHTITIRATDNCGATTDASLVVAVSKVAGSIADPAVCNGPGGVVDVTATVTNGSNSPQSATFTATLPAGLSALPGTCTANVGTCTVANASTVNWSGTPGGGQTVTISYKAQFGDTVTTGTTLCITSSATVGGSAPASVQACATLNCPAPSPGLPIPTANAVVSDQIAGSMLIYNLYTSSIDANRENTRISLTNIEPSRNAYVHLFFVDGSSCTVADSYICLTPNQTTSFLASDFDPGTTGYLIAVAVDERGCPVSFNYLIGDAYIKMASGHAANLGAEAVPAVAGGLPLCDGNSITALLNFDGKSYARLPQTLALSNITSPVDGNETRLVLNRIGGNMTTSASPLGPIFGILYDDTESGVSFTFNPGACQYRATLGNSFPRTTPRFGTIVPSGRSGWMKLYQTADQAMLGAAINYNANAAGAAAAFNQGHNLHKLTLTSAASLTIPVFPAGC